MSLLCLLILAIILILSESLITKTTSTRSIIQINRWSKQISNSDSRSNSRLFAAAPDAPRGKGPPPRKAPKDDVVQVTFIMNKYIYMYVYVQMSYC